jgi:hypothetical protein
MSCDRIDPFVSLLHVFANIEEVAIAANCPFGLPFYDLAIY